jgi:UDP-galactopyranose mutase
MQNETQDRIRQDDGVANGTGNNASNGNSNPTAVNADTLLSLANADGASALPTAIDLVCFSHLRWGFVYQRPQHLLSRWAKERRVFFIEEPVAGEGAPRLQIIHDSASGVRIVVPIIPHGLTSEATDALLEKLLRTLFDDDAVTDFIAWYYTPMALGFTHGLEPLATVYDCMDELSAFKGAPPALIEREAELFKRADLVFTGGVSLYEAKRDKHPSVHAFPSSVDHEHFMQARRELAEPEDQGSIPHPRIGFFGVIDERMDIDLVRGVAEARPDWHLVLIGPVVKIDPASLPQRDNIHYIGGRDYADLPSYNAGWDIAMMPFARNESTRFISPTKTPEYLAAGRPVISTSIADVVRPYGERGLVSIADAPREFIDAAEKILGDKDRENWLHEVDAFLSGTSWNDTWSRMRALVATVARARRDSASAQMGTQFTHAGNTAIAHRSLQGE